MTDQGRSGGRPVTDQSSPLTPTPGELAGLPSGYHDLASRCRMHHAEHHYPIVVRALAAAARAGVRDPLLCENCGHHLHRPNPGPCAWTGCACAGVRDPEEPRPDLAAALGEALDGVLPRMAFEQYGRYYTEDPDWDIEAYYRRVAESLIADHPNLLAALRSPVPALDVERLARAMDRADPPLDGFNDEATAEDHAEHLAYAEEIAREYAALAAQTPKEPA